MCEGRIAVMAKRPAFTEGRDRAYDQLPQSGNGSESSL